jgi:hypothetical protein
VSLVVLLLAVADKEGYCAMKKILLLVVLLAGLGCSPDGYRSDGDQYRPYQSRMMRDLFERRPLNEPVPWPSSPRDREDRD